MAADIANNTPKQLYSPLPITGLHSRHQFPYAIFLRLHIRHLVTGYILKRHELTIPFI